MNSWRYLTDDNQSAALGLAVDEALMGGYGRDAAAADPILRLYTYASHAALCGRFQHISAEIDLDACRASGTAFNRRPTGGGAIVMGSGQLGVAAVTCAPAAERPKSLLLKFSDGIVAGLAELGIEASFGGKNDLKVGRKKIAGLGLYLDGRGALLFHASVLADLDIPFMLQVLSTPVSKLGDQAVDLVRERVTTVTEETGTSWTGAALRDVIAAGFSKALDLDLHPSELTGLEAETAAQLDVTKYGTDEWLYQRAPQPDATATAVLKTPGGLVRLYLALSGSTIKSALFTGDFNHIPEPLAEFESRLKWASLDESEIERIASATLAHGTGLGVEPDALVATVMGAVERAAGSETAAPARNGSCYYPEQAPEVVRG
ncbi:MAG: lipoate--protein ligase [Acidimicrobiia bacterium]|nr:lipoate--protein ligase [Acidimicrobiia bacterium]